MADGKMEANLVRGLKLAKMMRPICLGHHSNSIGGTEAGGTGDNKDQEKHQQRSPTKFL
jgi:hypothetical protein